MKIKVAKELWMVIIGGLLLTPSNGAAQEGQVASTKEFVWLHHMPAVAGRLFSWPSDEVIRNKGVKAGDSEVAVARRQADQWLHNVIAPSWLPEEEPKVLFIRNEFGDCDVVHLQWVRNGYTIRVSQTASIFAMTLMPEDNNGMGKDASAQLSVARSLCLQIFVKQGTRRDDQGNAIVVTNLAENIASYSFGDGSIHNDGGVLVGDPGVMKQEGTDKRDREANRVDWDSSEDAWHYWFRLIRWRADGKSIKLVFPKLNGKGARPDIGIGIPDYGGIQDAAWFGLQQPTTGRRPRVSTRDE